MRSAVLRTFVEKLDDTSRAAQTKVLLNVLITSEVGAHAEEAATAIGHLNEGE